MKKFSLVLAASVLFAGMTFASPVMKQDNKKAKTEKPAKKEKASKSEKKATKSSDKKAK